MELATDRRLTMPGPPPKLPANRARNNTAELGVLVAPDAPLCDPPEDLLDETLEAWHDYWRNDVAGAVVDTDLPALCRLFEMRDQAARARREYKAAPLLLGSQGQPVMNPLGRFAQVLEKDIRPLEDRFGLTPLGRLRLGVTLGGAAEGLEKAADVAKRAEEAKQRADPRVADPRSPTADPWAAGGGLDGDGARPRRGRSRG